MNFIVGSMLKYLSEDEAFWVFAQINEAILPIDYYCGMVGVLIDQKVLEILLQEKFKPLVAHMETQSYHLDMLALNWLIALFFDVVNHEAEKFVLTAFLLKGPRTILQVALVIIDNLSEDIMNAESFDEIYLAIAKGPQKIKPEVLRCQLQKNKKC